MKILKITNGPLNQNCYVIEKDGKAIVIDPGIRTEKIIETIKKENVKPEFVLLTHGHFDHIYSAKALQDMGAKVYISEIDAPKLLSSELNMGFICGFNNVPECLPDGFLKSGKMKFLDEEFEIVETPGHTSGSVCIFYGNTVFTGDTYFSEGIYGRTDLLDGNKETEDKSIEKLLPLLKGKKILAGHEWWRNF